MIWHLYPLKQLHQIISNSISPIICLTRLSDSTRCLDSLTLLIDSIHWLYSLTRPDPLTLLGPLTRIFASNHWFYSLTRLTLLNPLTRIFASNHWFSSITWLTLWLVPPPVKTVPCKAWPVFRWTRRPFSCTLLNPTQRQVNPTIAPAEGACPWAVLQRQVSMVPGW